MPGRHIDGEDEAIHAPLAARIWSRLSRRVAALGTSRAERRMKVAEVLPLGGKRQLLLVVCDGRHFLLGAGSDGVQSMLEIGGAPIPPGKTAMERAS